MATSAKTIWFNISTLLPLVFTGEIGVGVEVLFAFALESPKGRIFILHLPYSLAFLLCFIIMRPAYESFFSHIFDTAGFVMVVNEDLI